MGVSKPLPDREAAMEWILSAIGEDQNQAMADRSIFNCDYGVGDDVFQTSDVNRTCWYCIAKEEL